ncbi:MAG: hypothetical protein KIS81_00955 [Maricaulaceae bacterium]|nr:hypothetical protein [Maricaulaceae bacterium]
MSEDGDDVRRAALDGREIIIEFIAIGGAVRVAAVDVQTGEEAVIQAPKSASRDEMERVALAKLAKRLGLSPENQRPGAGPGRGKLV